MHNSLEQITQKLRLIIEHLNNSIPDDTPFNITHNNWSFPGVSRLDLIDEAQSIIRFIEDHGVDDLGEHEARINNYLQSLDFLHAQTVPNIWGNAANGVPAFLNTTRSLRNLLSAALPREERKEEDKLAEARTRNRRVFQQLSSAEREVKGLRDRTSALDDMVSRIEGAYTAAENLPTDLQIIRDGKELISQLTGDANKEHDRIVRTRENTSAIEEQMRESAKSAETIIDRSHAAYSAATSVGLAAAFDRRSESLSRSMRYWVFGLFAALIAAGVLGWVQLSSLTTILNTSGASVTAILMNVILAILSIGAPVWFAWLSTKQIGQRFRLAEDYAFKASISQAYEGFRKEAERIDENLEKELLASALKRLDELPLRLVERESHGSPLHEFASSKTVRKFISKIMSSRETPEAASESKPE